MTSIINKNRTKRAKGKTSEERRKAYEAAAEADRKEIALWQELAKELSELRKRAS